MPDRSSFVAALRQERDAFARFLGLLEAESAALIRGDVDQLLRLADAKSSQVNELGSLSEERRAFLRAEGFSPDRVGMAQWLIVHGQRETPSLSRVWEDLLTDAGAARQINETNGVLIEAHLRFNRSALAILRGGMSQTATYGPDGSPDIPVRGRALGLA